MLAIVQGRHPRAAIRDSPEWSPFALSTVGRHGPITDNAGGRPIGVATQTAVEQRRHANRIWNLKC